ncbi:hypothetical protein Hanom_Chr09g00800441 [Helianthus anomalus]
MDKCQEKIITYIKKNSGKRVRYHPIPYPRNFIKLIPYPTHTRCASSIPIPYFRVSGIFVGIGFFAIPIWCNIAPIYAFSIKHLLQIHENGVVHKVKKKSLYVVILTAMWLIWQARNEAVFNNPRITVSKIIEYIKAISFLWVKIRSNLRSLEWEKWCSFSFCNNFDHA